MAEGFGLALGLTSLALQLYSKCNNSSTNFHDLHLDLKTFHQTLLLTERYLPRLDDSRIACEKLVIEIEKLLSEHTSRNPLRRVKVKLGDIQPVRARLILQISALHASVNMLKDRDIEIVNATVLEGSLTSTSTLGLTSSTSSLLTPTISHVSNELTGNPRSMHYSASSSSINSVQTGRSSLSTPFEPRRGSSRTSISREPEVPDAAFLTNTWALDTGISLENILIRISSTHEELPDHTEQVRLLLQEGASLAYKDPECLRPPLICAILAGRTDLVKLFLEQDSTPDGPIEIRDGIWDWTPLTWAIMQCNAELLQLLINKGANITATDNISNRTPLLWAASIGNFHAAETLLTHDPTLIHATDKHEMTPLALAYFEGHIETARLLVMRGDDPSFRFESGSSLLAWALVAKDEAFAQLLIERDADARGTNMHGLPVLILGIRENSPLVVQRLLARGADVQCRDENGTPALTLAVRNQFVDIVDILVQNGADVKARDGEGNTALLWAVWRSDERLVERLVKRGAAGSDVDGRGVSVRGWAEWTGNERIVRLVAEAA